MNSRKTKLKLLTLLSDQHQISPCNVNAYSAPEVMRIKDMITEGEFSGYFSNFSLVVLQEKYGDKIR